MFYKLEKMGPNEWCFAETKSTKSVWNDMDRASDYIDKGDLDNAEKILRKIITRYPLYIEALHLMALVYSQRDKSQEYYLFEKEVASIGQSCFPNTFKKRKDKLEWGWVENRTFLRALHSLGMVYLDRGWIEEAMEIFEDILSFNPNDNQGIRALVIDCYFLLKEPDKVLKLCENYKNDILAEVAYGLPLALFQLGRIEEAEKALKEAIKFKPLIAQELLKKKHTEPESAMPGYITVGGEDEAYQYWESSEVFWKKTKGALALLLKQVKDSGE